MPWDRPGVVLASPLYRETACGWETLGKIPFPKTIPSKSEGVGHCIQSTPFSDPELVWVTNTGQKEEMSGIVLTSNLKYTCGLREWAEDWGECKPQPKSFWVLRPPLWLTTFPQVCPLMSLFLNPFPPEATLGEGNPRRQVEKVRPGHQAAEWREDKGKIFFLLAGSCGSRSRGGGKAGPVLTGNRLYQSPSWPPFASAVQPRQGPEGRRGEKEFSSQTWVGGL